MEPIWNKEKNRKDWILLTVEDVEQWWQETAAGFSLDLFLEISLKDAGVAFTQSKANKGWTSKLEHKMRSNGRHGDYERNYDETNKTGFGRNSYWVFQAVIGLHSKIDKINEQITRQILVENLKPSKTLSEFDAPDTKASSVFKWIAAAASTGGGPKSLPGAAMVPGPAGFVTAGLAIIGSISSQMADAESKENIEANNVAVALGDAFGSPTKGLEDTLRVATGGGVDGNDWINIISDNLKMKVATEAMKASKLHLVADRHIDAETREGYGTDIGRQWMELRSGEEYCFYLMRESADTFWEEAEPRIYEVMERYGIGNRVPFYAAIIDCALNGYGNGVPRCYFDVPAVFYDENGGSGRNINLGECDVTHHLPDTTYVT
ncbi:uncharacterized protein BDZ83DRAFT_724959 [Colletotrichum acutatum]|uniref:Uncharacterized protein n=1 Tax=Glomerella acutata TaxID=27357 RepID=A0AAD8UB28_GLOAC|nr:uncharacterized protein BDZ83DRAFT_724959 [Colletotrichum acutatum]KAK1705029.1 hypothetical protein BDZ83DRAFT_724959 [Colletotrichum acutatum]